MVKQFAFYAYDLDGAFDLIGHAGSEYGLSEWRQAFRIWRTYDATGQAMPQHAKTTELDSTYGRPLHTS